MDYINMGTGFTTMRRETPIELLQLCEAESVSYLDEVASNTATQDTAKSVGLEVLALLKKVWYRFKTVKCSLRGKLPNGQLELKTKLLADAVSNASNYLSFIMNCVYSGSILCIV
ncbi:uncharacterized protein LOC121791036 [Salvia splendens]|uniref:uncharacterized protein LOC121791036 n=1 Tax=Salvia splendens TaxID=180675 RepID=UPI001C2564FC|nr:uncharacterized protein LOC121791036 [Salvia splendens]